MDDTPGKPATHTQDAEWFRTLQEIEAASMYAGRYARNGCHLAQQGAPSEQAIQSFKDCLDQLGTARDLVARCVEKLTR